MKIHSAIIIPFLLCRVCFSQSLDTSGYSITVTTSNETDNYFTTDLVWRGADGASSVDLENGKVLWLFSDSFICSDSSGDRNKSTIIRNSIAIQDGHDVKTARIKYYWDKSKKAPEAFFQTQGKFWFWTGNGIMVKDKLLIFLMKVHRVKKGIGYEAFGWYAVLVSNPLDEPSKWKMHFIEGGETFGTIAGSAAILNDSNYVYAFGAVEPATHEVYLLRWKMEDAYLGNLSHPEWWLNGKWAERNTKYPIPEPLFIGGTEYSVHYDTTLKKYIQIQSFGFGAGQIGIRMSDSIQGKWSEPYMFYTPQYPGVKKPFMYAAKAHPELKGDGVYVTYNVNSFDLGELIENQTLYFPRFILVKIVYHDEN